MDRPSPKVVLPATIDGVAAAGAAADGDGDWRDDAANAAVESGAEASWAEEKATLLCREAGVRSPTMTWLLNQVVAVSPSGTRT